ncbi:MAG TPA: cation acetate symporter, partial [Candidatus Ozemobacteraceae bacterium]|nr:cation acetate symporter [Candidatus Ozemobacteraceae bacterium]
MELMPVILFLFFVGLVLGLSFYFGRQTKSATSYFAAGGTIHWAVNGIAFAGDYLSAASFLGICGMIATAGYDGFLYSIGYLAGWIVALFVVAEPMKRLGKYTFTDALDAKFNSKGIQLAAAISTLVVSLFYLIPQMVGAGVLVTPLLGLPHAAGVIMVGMIVIIIVATAGMTSTTYVQFLKGGMLVVFSLALSIMVCQRGLTTTPDQAGTKPFYAYQTLAATASGDTLTLADPSWQLVGKIDAGGATFVKLSKGGAVTYWKKETKEGEATVQLRETQSLVVKPDGSKIINGAPASPENQLRQVGNLEEIRGKTGAEAVTGAIGPFELMSILGDSSTKARLWKEVKFKDGEDQVKIYTSYLVPGNKLMRPGMKFKVEGTTLEKIDFISLMLALFLGTAALPHILIRYYTVPSPACARKSTIVAIAAIGFFYVLTLYMGFGAMVNCVVNPADNNMSAPLLAKSFGVFLFSVISAIAFATVLGTVSGLIVAASGAVAHDIMDRYLALKMNEKQKVMAGKVSAFVVGIIAIILGIIFQGVNVTFLVGLAFAVAASANLPSVIMLLFWKKTTPHGIVASISTGIVVSIGIILFSPDMYALYGFDPKTAPIPFTNPGIFSIPASFFMLVAVSLLTKAREGVALLPEL